MPLSTEEVKSVEKAITLIETLAEANQSLPLQEISKRTGYAKSTVHRLLSTLRAHDIVEQSTQDGRYLLGIRLFELGCSISNNWDVAAIARPYMQNIANELNESICLSILSRGEALIMSFMESTSAFHVVSKVGSPAPGALHGTGEDYAFVSFAPAGAAYHPRTWHAGLHTQHDSYNRSAGSRTTTHS